MADIEIVCPFCEQALEVPEEMIGEVVECPACQKEFKMEASEAEEAGDADDSEDAEEGTCPACGADMEGGAVLCLACGYHSGLGRKIKTNFG